MKKADRKEYEKKVNILITVIIILLIFLGLAITAKQTPAIIVEEITVLKPPDKFCTYIYAQIKLSGDNYRIEYKINEEGTMQHTTYTKSLDQLTTDVRTLYLDELITMNQYHCLLAGIKGHEMKAK